MMNQTREEKIRALLDDRYEEDATDEEGTTLYHNCGTDVWLRADGTYEVTINFLCDPPTHREEPKCENCGKPMSVCRAELAAIWLLNHEVPETPTEVKDFEDKHPTERYTGQVPPIPKGE
jgi:hypothetical protein